MFLPALQRALALLALLAVLQPSGAAAAGPIGLLTIVDGEAAVLRDTERFAAVEGLRLRAEDIVRTGEQTRLARIELSDGTTLDLGPATELLLQPAALGQRATTLYLARGWLKVGSRPAVPAADAGIGIASAAFDLQHLSGSAVLHLSPQAALVFAESGSVELIERNEGRPGSSRTVRDGDAWSRRGSAAGSLARRPPADLMQGLPRGFADTLPRLAARFESRTVEPGPADAIAYAEVASWINGEAALRPTFLHRFAGRARDREFRAGLVAELRAHPGWDRLLFPEKYRPKPPVIAVRRPAPAASAPAAVAVTTPALTPVAVNLQGLMTWPSNPAMPTTKTESR